MDFWITEDFGDHSIRAEEVRHLNTQLFSRTLKYPLLIGASFLLVGNWLYLTFEKPFVGWEGFLRTAPERNQFLLHLAVVVLMGLTRMGRITGKHAAVVLCAVVFDLVVGRGIYLIGGIPLYLDSVGAVLVAVMLGPTAGAVTACMTTMSLYFIAPEVLPLAMINIIVAVIAGTLAKFGGFNSLLTIVLGGLFAGVVAALIAAPIALNYMSVVIDGTDMPQFKIGAYLMGTLLGPPVSDGIPSDPLDKAVVFLIAGFASMYLMRRFSWLRDRNRV